MTNAPLAQAEWLALREPVDAAARAEAPVRQLSGFLPSARPLVIRDLGCGTGAMGRWLAPRLPGPQHWVVQDRDEELLALLRSRAGGFTARDGSIGTITVEHAELCSTSAAHLAGTGLLTSSALLDLLTAPEVDRLAAVCAAAACPALFALSVTGQVELTPADPWDAAVAEAFNAHQRRRVGEQALLGPDAPPVARTAFRNRGAVVRTWPSTWWLSVAHPELTVRWLRDRVRAASEQDPELAPVASDYVHRRLTQLRTGELRVRVHHEDLLAIPGGMTG